jgi:hypothetical protein
MKFGVWKRIGASLLVGALAVIASSPLAALAAAPSDAIGIVPPGEALPQLGGQNDCTLLAGGLTGALQSGGISQLASLGAGGFYGPYYNPAFGTFGLGSFGGFMNFSGGQPSRSASVSAFPQCQGLLGTTGAGGVARGRPFVVRDFGPVGGSLSGLARLGFGGAPFGRAGLLGGGFAPFGLGTLGGGTTVIVR